MHVSVSRFYRSVYCVTTKSNSVAFLVLVIFVGNMMNMWMANTKDVQRLLWRSHIQMMPNRFSFRFAFILFDTISNEKLIQKTMKHREKVSSVDHNNKRNKNSIWCFFDNIYVNENSNFSSSYWWRICRPTEWQNDLVSFTFSVSFYIIECDQRTKQSCPT